MGHRSSQPRDAQELEASLAPILRFRVELFVHDAYASSLKHLERQKTKSGTTVSVAIDADLASFFDDWKNGVSEQELKITWDYKWLSCSSPNFRRLRQIHVLGRRYRVLLALDPGPPIRFWAMDAFLKDNNQQKQAIKTACERARNFWREIRT